MAEQLLDQIREVAEGQIVSSWDCSSFSGPQLTYGRVGLRGPESGRASRDGSLDSCRRKDASPFLRCRYLTIFIDLGGSVPRRLRPPRYQAWALHHTRRNRLNVRHRHASVALFQQASRQMAPRGGRTHLLDAAESCHR